MAKPLKTAPRKAAPKPNNGSSSPSEEVAAAPATATPLTSPPPEPGAQPSFKILGQYLKDLSFENPNAPTSLAPQQTQPDINIAVNVNARNLGPNDFEVELHLDAKASGGEKVIFAAELLYAGILHQAVLIECPRMLFPFARQVLADATRNGGFPPLMLDPIDFAAMYQQRIRQQATATA
jgi:preprotein translocase subunit SecB